MARSIDIGYVTDYWAIHHGELAVNERRARASAHDDTRSWVDPNGYRLSDRIWQQKAGMRETIDQRIRQAIASGESANDLANSLAGFLTESAAQQRVRTPTGRMGVGSYPARRLARTEISRAHGQATVESVKALGPHADVKWRTSGSHPEPDECDVKANADRFNLGPGVYPAADVPQYPSHPNCLCRLQPHVSDDDDAIVAAVRNEFGLNDPVLAPLDTALDLLPPSFDVTTLNRMPAPELGEFFGSLLDAALGRVIPEPMQDVAEALGVDLTALVSESIDLGAVLAAQREMQAAVQRLERQVRRGRTVARRRRKTLPGALPLAAD